MPFLKLPKLPSGFRIIESASGAATNTFQIWFQRFADAIENSINGIAAALVAAGIALDAAAAANAAAAAANAAASAAQGSTDAQALANSLTSSGIINVATPPLLSADSTGTITVSTHDRLYGDSTLNPTVTVTGGAFATAFVNPDVVYVYYSDPSRAGGAVTYLTSLDPADAVQTGDIHSVGAVQIPAAGSNDGNFVQPPGIVIP